MPLCILSFCVNRLFKTEEVVNIFFSFLLFLGFSFPKNIERRKLWVAALRRKEFQPTKYSKICADHFEDACFDRTGQTTRLRDTAVPTIFAFPSHLNKVISHTKCTLIWKGFQCLIMIKVRDAKKIPDTNIQLIF